MISPKTVLYFIAFPALLHCFSIDQAFAEDLYDQPLPVTEVRKTLLDTADKIKSLAYVDISKGEHISWKIPLAKREALRWITQQSLKKKGPIPWKTYYPRSRTQIFFMFVLPSIIIFASIFFRTKQKANNI